jgi:hypothetical protein
MWSNQRLRIYLEQYLDSGIHNETVLFGWNRLCNQVSS